MKFVSQERRNRRTIFGFHVRTIIEVPADARHLRLHVKGFGLISPEADMPLD
jgi:hypothetical protein